MRYVMCNEINKTFSLLSCSTSLASYGSSYDSLMTHFIMTYFPSFEGLTATIVSRMSRVESRKFIRG
jgi:hypothetical protein